MLQWRHLYIKTQKPRWLLRSEQLQLAVAVVVACVSGIVVPLSRVRLGYHTAEQVVVGSAVGGMFGLAWAYFAISRLVAPLWSVGTVPTWWEQLIQDSETAKEE